ncbi:hypothetical protein, partial [Marinibactrum halimedae]|uniref:hypothetical protein n=1 Tax=Marinibactrum halimedae TaxID=1444977 RepID=UPI0024E1830A
MDKNCDNVVSDIASSQKSIHGIISKHRFIFNVHCEQASKTFYVGVVSRSMHFSREATYRNLSRYSGISEKRFSRW